MHGHFQTSVPKTDSNDVGMESFQGEKLNMGIALVVPATKIMEVINQPGELEIRQQELKKLETENMPSADDTNKPSTK